MRVPDAKPAGAAYGRLLDANGMSIPGGEVDLTQDQDFDWGRLTGQIFTLGLICILPGACSDPVWPAAVSDNGLWHIGSENIESGKGLTFTGREPNPKGGYGARTRVFVPQRATPQRVPDIVLWQPELRLVRTDDGAEVSWPAISGVPLGKELRYELEVTTDRGWLYPDVPPGATSVRIPAWQVEDGRMGLTVAATTKKRRTGYVYSTPSLEARGPAKPLSRGRACLVEQEGALVRVANSTCPLTDGNLSRDGERLQAPHDCDRRAEPGCESPEIVRACVDLGEPTPVSLVALRAQWARGVRVELSADGRDFRVVTQLRKERADDTYGVPLPPGTATRYVCVRGRYGVNRWDFDEISVW